MYKGVGIMNAPNYLELGEKITQLRKTKNISRTKLSEKAGVSVSFLYQLEHGKCGLSVETLYRIANVLDVSPAYLLSVNSSRDNKRILTNILQKYDKKILEEGIELFTDLSKLGFF